MGRLIDADALMKRKQEEYAYHDITDSEFEDLINSQPTAYDVEKVEKTIEALPMQDFLGVAHIPRISTLNIVKMGGNSEMPRERSWERLSGDYIRGYTKAIRDVEESVVSNLLALKVQKVKWSIKIIKELFECIMEHRAKIREKKNGFVRWNVISKKFEWYECKE